MNNWPDHEQILSRYRDWLDQTQAECDLLDGQSADDETSVEPIGLYQLAELLTALRHDVKLMTKASRGVEERNEATLLSMNAAIEQFRAVAPQEDEAAQKAARPLVEAIVGLDESLVRGRRVIEQARQRVLEEWNTELGEVRDRLDELYRTQPWWRRAIIRPWHRATRDVYSGRSLETGRNIFDSLLEGYNLIQNRLRRAMQEQLIVRMECIGEMADPHCMTVVEVVADPSRRAGTVVEEVRPGYHWAGTVLRFAEVKAVGER
jgi:molecular chaperone GrpE (heat shock protein)